DIVGIGHVMCHHAKAVPSVMAGLLCDGNHQEWRQTSVMSGRKSDGRTGSNEDIRIGEYHYLLSSWSTQTVLSYQLTN
ncbi:hypothetical protein COCMIDRAFT_111309, partial [Bipolaris oryzae ATCC 44560]